MAASIVAVADALYSVSRKLRSCAKTIAHAGKEVKAIAKEMSAFSILMRSLRDTLQLLTPLFIQAHSLVTTCENLVRQAEENVEELDRFLEDLEPLRNSKGGSLIAKMIARLRWAFQKTDFLLLRAKLESSKLTLGLCMTAIQTRVAVEQLAAAQRGEKDETEVKKLKRQV